MYYDLEVKIPVIKGKITRRTRGSNVFVEYKEQEVYDNDKGYSEVKRVTIGKVVDNENSLMVPNEVYFDLLHPEDKPEIVVNEERNVALGFGMYAVLDTIYKEFKLPELLTKCIKQEHKPELILDLIAYLIITENNAAFYYSDYAEGHVLFTKDMHIYYESTVGRILKSITNNERQAFLKEWNKNRNKNYIYISYDSTNKNIQAGDIELSEWGNSKINTGEKIINYSVAYDLSNKIPLFYEVYSGSLTDTTQFKETVTKAYEFGYKNICFILDRGYFSTANIIEMDEKGFDFIMFVKGLKSKIAELVLEHKDEFVNKRKSFVEDYNVYGTTVIDGLFNGDKKDRYFHLFYDHQRAYYEKRDFDKGLNRAKEAIEEVIRKKLNVEFSKDVTDFFEILRNEDGVVIAYKEKEDVTQQAEDCFGFFSIVTSKKMSYEEAIHLYKSRDSSEKLFAADKTFLGGRSYRVHSTESLQNKSFVAFLALIVRNRIFTLLQAGKQKRKANDNFYSVPKAIKQLEKIMLCENMNGDYRINKNITATCQRLISLFGLNVASLRETASVVADKLKVTKKTKSDEANIEDAETTQEEMYENEMYIDY